MHARKFLIVVSAAFSILFAAPLTYAQGGCGRGGWGPSGAYWRLYDVKTVTTIRGEVTAIRQVAPLRGMGRGVHLDVKTERETVAVHLGPDWYVRNQELSFQVKDKVDVKGSRVTADGQSFIIASEIRKGSELLVLRDDSGQPLWCGARRGPPHVPNG